MYTEGGTSRWGNVSLRRMEPPRVIRLVSGARNLKDLRERNNLSQADVAKVLHCSQVAYGMYELGKRKLPVERLIILAKYYHVSLDYLVGLA